MFHHIEEIKLRKALIKEIEDSQTQDKSKKEIVRDPYFTSHDNIRLKSHKYPEDYNNLVIDDIKFKLMSTIESLEIKNQSPTLHQVKLEV